MGKRFYLVSFIIIIIIVQSLAQTGGREIYQFLNLSPGARVAALGGMPIAWRTTDPGAVFQNPALLTEEQSGIVYFAHQSYFDDISSGDFSYSHHLSNQNINFQAGVHYVNYGNIPNTNVYGNVLGDFKSSESDIYLAASRSIKERLILGASLQFVFSSLGFESSQGLCFNTGLTYFNPDKESSLGLVIKNAGFQLNNYNNLKESLPLEVQIGFAKKLKHLPLVYHITFQHLESWDVSYDDPALANDGLLFGEVSKSSGFSKFFNNFLRHFVIGTELFLNKKENFVIRLGYNHLRKSDLALSDYRSFSGLSFGFGLKIYKFKIDYSYSNYHLAGGAGQINISTNINSFFKKDM